MSGRMTRIAAASVGTAMLAASAATFALASIPAPIDDTAPGFSAVYAVEETIVLPLPASGTPFFISESGAEERGCITGEQVATRFAAEREQFGGETVKLADGLEQAFADAWRAEVNMKPVPVSSVIAHAFSDGESAAVDVVEIGSDGCAISRTLLSGDDWNTILAAVAAPAV